MNVLSLFDGISCSRVALGDRVGKYYASEVDKYAIKIAMKNYPDTIQLGDVRNIVIPDGIDLLIGGSPCQDLSIAKKGRRGLDGERSGLFWEYVRVLRACKPRYFVLENVASMPKEARDTISRELGVEPILINASLVSAQSRKRLFWTNIKVDGLPDDRGILLKDILQPDAEIDERMTSKGKAFCLDASYYKGSSAEHSIEKKNRTMVRIKKENKEFDQIGYFGSPTSSNVGGQALRVYDTNKKSATSGDGLYNVNGVRKLTPIECERLQSLPDDYTFGISNTQRYKCLGNGFNVEVIKHIVRFMEI